MDNMTKKLISDLRQLREKFMENESCNRQRSEENNGKNEFSCGYYDGRADGYIEAYTMLGRVVSSWAEECARQLQM